MEVALTPLTAMRMTSSCSGPCYGVAGAAHVRHFIVHTRRAGQRSVRPLNCGVMPLRFGPTLTSQR